MDKRYCVFLAVIPFLLFSGVIEREFSFPLNNLEFTKSQGYDVVRFKGCTPTTFIGEPELVTMPISVLIPPSAVVRRVEIISAEKVPVQGAYMILPCQHPEPLSVHDPPPFAEPRDEIYAMQTEYPGILAQHTDTRTKGGFRIATILLYPLQYVPKEGRLYLYTQIKFKVIYEEGRAIPETIWKEEYEYQKQGVKRLVINPEHIEVWQPLIKECDRTARSGIDGRTFDNPEYVIMVADEFENALKKLRDWKTKKGVPAEIFTRTWILSNYTGVDDAERVRNFVIDYHQNHGSLYFLCVGDHGDFPVQEDPVANDFYYQDYDDDFRSEVFVGRASVSTPTEAETFVNKVLCYEKEPPSSGFHEKIFLPAYSVSGVEYGAPVNDTIAKYDPPSWQDAKRYWYISPLLTDEISDSFNVGFAYTNISSHGEWYGWCGHSDLQGHRNEHADALTNAPPFTGVVTAICCFLGYFDCSEGDCYVEHMMNNPDGGATAFWGNTRPGYKDINNYGRTEWLCIWFYDELNNNNVYNIGKTCAASKDRAAEYTNDSAVIWCMRNLNLFGDPEMVLWTSFPRELEVVHDDEIDIGPQTFDVTVTENGVPVENACVCIWNKKDAIYQIKYTGASGAVSFDIDPKSGNCDTLYVTVTKENIHRPYSGHSIIGPGPFIVAHSWIIDDTDDGNGDGWVSPGEAIDLGVWGENVGSRIASNVAGVLTTLDPCVDVNVPFARYGRIRVGDSALSKPDYTFTVSSNCRYGHVIQFDLEYRDRNDTAWVSHPEIVVHAPVLIHDASRIANDDNDDARLELDETGDLLVTLTNEGDISAPDVFALLQSESPHIQLNKNLSQFGSFTPGETNENVADPFNVTFISATSAVTEIDFSLIIWAGIYRDTLYFILPVYPPDLKIQDVQVVNDENLDEMLEPGEVGELVVTIENQGEATANNVTAVLRTSSAYVTIMDSTCSFGTVVSGGNADNSGDNFKITSDAETPYFSENDFTLAYTSSYVDVEDFTFHVGTYPPGDNRGRYFAFYSTGPHVQSPNFEWIAIDSTQDEYPGTWLQLHWDWFEVVDLPFTFTFYGKDYDEVRICTNGLICFDLSAACWKGTNQPIPYKDNGWPECRARAFIAGVWDEHLGPYNYGGEPGYMYYYYDEPNHRFIIEYWGMRHHGPIEYETFEIILYDPAYYPTPNGDGEIVVQYLTAMQPGRTEPWSCGNTVGIENHTERVGVEYYFAGEYHELVDVIADSFTIKYTPYPKGSYPKCPYGDGGGGRDGCAEWGSTSTPLKTLLLTPYPNPFKEMTVLSYQIADPAKTENISLKIYDITGRLVKQFEHLTIQPFNQVIWDGCDDRGRAVSAGVYFIRFEADDYGRTEKTILLK